LSDRVSRRPSKRTRWNFFIHALQKIVLLPQEAFRSFAAELQE
jgi:hypothetical protein